MDPRTRSFCYVDDLVEGLFRLLMSEEHDPVNIGNPNEITILELASVINNILDNSTEIIIKPASRLGDDPQRRRPDITRAKEILKWEPKIQLDEGIKKTIPYFRQKLGLA